MNFYTRKKRPLVINIVALIDILTILLIFFIVTTTFKKIEPEVEIELPESTTAQAAEEKDEPIFVYVSKEEKVYIGEDEVKLDNLVAELKHRKAREPRRAFALKMDTNVPVGFFVKVLDASTEAGLPNLSLMTEEPEATRTAPQPRTGAPLR